jgi:hypothetical protein
VGTGLCAVGLGSPEDIYQIVPAASGLLDIDVTADKPTFDPLFYIREEPCKDGKELACASAGTGGVIERAQVSVKAGKSYSLFVDGVGPANKGKYYLTLNLSAPKGCGDGLVVEPEACDDGSPGPDQDGCAENCTQLSGTPESGTSCAGFGQPVHLWGSSRRVSLTGDNSKGTNEWASNGGNCTNEGNERIYAVTPHESGTLEVTATSNFDLMLLARSSCATPESGGAFCANKQKPPSLTPEVLSIPVVKDVIRFIAVDGLTAADKGTYSLNFQLK